MNRSRLSFAVFTCGAAVMAFELAGSRVMAPAVGTSLIVWTALIGVILGSLSAGYWLGGRAADRHPDVQNLGVVIAWSAVAIAATALLHGPVIGVLAVTVRDVRLASLLGASLLFAPAAVLLGTVTPWAAKLCIRDLATDGAAVGTLSALSTAGSIVGTFVAGYLLIASFGTTATLSVLALTVAGTALVLSPYRRVFVLSGVAVIAALAALLPGYTRILSVDTRYQRAFISTAVDGPTGRPIRTLSTDPFGVQGAVFTDGDGVVFRYIRFFRLGESLGIPVNRTLTIGGAVYSWPRDFLARNAQSHATVIELDPGMTDIARRHFGLGDDARMTIVHEDGRVFLNRSRERFDAIYLDAFSGTTIPFQLLTREAVGRMSDLLVPGGVVIANLIGSVTGPTSALVQSAGATFNEVFPFVYLFPLGTEPTAPQNIILLASETDLTDVLAAAVDPLGGETLQPIMPSGGQVLTDDRAPVEQMTARLFF